MNHSSNSPTDQSPEGDSPSWFERPENINKLIIGLLIACAIVTLADLFYTNPHAHFAIESTFAFQAWFGFVTFVVVVYLGKILRWFVQRDEDYYDR